MPAEAVGLALWDRVRVPTRVARPGDQVVAYNGWEYAVLERELGAFRDPSRKMLVTVRPGGIARAQPQPSRAQPHRASSAPLDAPRAGRPVTCWSCVL